MRRAPPLPKELWDRIPLEIQAALRVVIDGYEQRIAALEAQVAALQVQLQQNSQNSSRPPSSDGPQVKRKPPRPPSGRKRGVQPGHPLYQRVLVPVEEVEEVMPCKPTHCRRCGGALQGTDPQPHRHQVIEVPPPVPQVKEYQLHRLPCARCGITTCGTLPPGVPALGYGPRLASLVGLCSGAYRMSKRMVANFCTDVLRVPLALGEVCHVAQTVATALDLPVQEARTYIQGQDANVDETPWRQQQRRAWLWVVVTQGVSVFCIRASRGAKVLWELLGEEYGGVLTSDRAKAYNGQPLQSRQICWAHLRRDFQARIDRGGAGAAVGEILLEQADVLFGWWHWVRGTAPGPLRRFKAICAGCAGHFSKSWKRARAVPALRLRPPAKNCSKWSRPCGRSRAGRGSIPPTTRRSGRCATPCSGARPAMGRTVWQGVILWRTS